MTFQEFAFELAKTFPRVQISIINAGEGIEISGFCKSGTAVLYKSDDGSLCLKTRYGHVDYIESAKDVALVAFDWWQKSVGRFDGWNNPPFEWEDAFAEYGLISVKEETSKKYEVL